MNLWVLLASSDTDSLALIERALTKLSISLDTASSLAGTDRALGSRRFDGVVLDCQQFPEAFDLMQAMRKRQTNRTLVLIALTAGESAMTRAFNTGATFVLEKPLSYDRALRCFRAAHGLLLGERRRYYRHPIEMAVYLRPDGSADITAGAVNVSSGGMAVTLGAAAVQDKPADIRFSLPSSRALITGRCKIVWSSEGRAGIQFVKLEKAGRQALDEWLAGCFEYANQQKARKS